ncbi:HEXXH motif-containing putative peptide modification protein [Hydrogenophaga sp. PAMC20947]|uniref:aKG-HExxH-type peptide beta-hydroxylase n=1 Tax=Hydrogenophaga sp. PAMC20947 TaxID=2565558 RepID=UPI00109D9EAD|nr:HEXXH motif-containing putative peptide modification protein [Hydrogenophaga sp. PAMC20947]QCB47020.1 HEXXH motif domain-containing protein [Hydrogenophaga sp. PAMC20947]
MQFEPSGQRGRRLDAEMQADLLQSLQHIARACEPSEISRNLAHPIELMKGGHAMPPSAFGLYFHLGETLFDERLDDAALAASELSRCGARRPGMVVQGRGSEASRRLDQTLDWRLEEGAKIFAPVAGPEVDAFRELLDQGMSLLALGAPGLHAEIAAFLSEVVVARSPAGGAIDFDGASHYQFWGLLMLNPLHHRNRLAVAEVLAHESGHSVLFGMSRESTLVLNPDDELYDSPLRTDPRPMDGIFHATYVSARMAWAMETLLDSGCLSADERDQALSAAHLDRDNFHKGVATVDMHAQLTPSGRAIMDEARRWILASDRTNAGYR